MVESTLLVAVGKGDSDSESDTTGTKGGYLATFRDMHTASWALQRVIVDRNLHEQIQLVLFHPAAKKNLYAEYGPPESDVEQ